MLKDPHIPSQLNAVTVRFTRLCLCSFAALQHGITLCLCLYRPPLSMSRSLQSLVRMSASVEAPEIKAMIAPLLPRVLEVRRVSVHRPAACNHTDGLIVL